MMREAQKGQIFLLIILVMAVALTISLSVSSRTTTTLRTSIEEENSERAFSAAEAGLEQSLNSKQPVSGSFSNNSSYQTAITELSGSSFLLNNGMPILKDDGVDIWLSRYPDYTNQWSGDMTVYWGQDSDACANSEADNTLAALEIIVITGTKADPKVTRYALDPCSQRSKNNYFEEITGGGGIINGKTFFYKKTISVTSGFIARIIPLYSSAIIGVTGCDGQNNNCLTLPAQGTLIESVGISDNTQRKIVSLQPYPKLPMELFSYTMFSPK